MDDLFPHSQVRPKQDELKATVEQALEDGSNVVTHAPTGLGKTAATLPQCLSHGLENDKTTFFLTPRHSQHEIALECLQQVKEKHNTRFVVADLIGKSHLCEGANMPAFEDEDGDGEKCPRWDNTYTDNHQLTDRARRMKNSLKRKILRAEEVKEECSKVCPYEILMHLAAEADVVVGDYFHIFHPKVREVIFSKSSLALKDCNVIVDEAHNLPDRTRRLHSAVLTENMIDEGRKEAEDQGYYEEGESLERLQRELERMAKHELGMDEETEIGQDTFTDRVASFADYDHLIEDLDAVAKEALEEKDESVCGDIAEFLDRWRGKDHGFVRVFKKVQYGNQNPYLRLAYTCLNPQYATKEPFKRVHTAIAMSGTLMPVDMYVDLFGMDPETTHTAAYGSPFPDENKHNLIVDKVTTQYKERDEKEYQKMAWYIMKSVENVPGNAGVFFPSYELRDEVHDRIKDRLDKPVFLEDRTMDKEEKNRFLDKFAEKTDEGAVLLGVVAGSFGEGVDFPGDLMSAVFVVGLPLQRPDLETQALIDFYDDTFDGDGWDYGYNFPAVNRALQAAGRCIRSHEDEGVVVFMDKRYAWNKYRKALPAEDFTLTKAPWLDIDQFFN
jgi:DNA excision repair protein ERCC-2